MTDQAELYDRVSTGQYKCGLELIEMSKPNVGDFILDIGSGTGALTFELAKLIQAKGQLHAIEPDVERMIIAKHQKPKELSNIIWHESTLDTFKAPKIPMFNIAYSNYVFHWIKDQKSAVKNIYDNLLDGGCFAFCCVFGMPQVIRDLCELIGEEGKKITGSLHFTPKKTWLKFFEDVGFKVKTIKDVPDYDFNNIDEVMVWWEATTHGIFSINKLTHKMVENLREKYPGSIHIYRNETLRLLAVK